MARRVLNVSSTVASGILSVTGTRTSQLEISESNNEWKSSNGYSWTHTRTKTDSYSFCKLAWDGGNTVHSYFAGMGLRCTRPGGSQGIRYGWSYFWHNNAGSDSVEHLFSLMQGWEPADFNNESGNHLMQIGWSSSNGGTNRPSSRWSIPRSQDSRGNADNRSYSWMYEVDSSKVSYETGSGGGS